LEEFLKTWGYLGVFLAIIASGVGFPLPEEVPVVAGGAICGSENAYWWMMLPLCIGAVVLGDSMLYAIGRFWGQKLVLLPFVQKHLLPPERMHKVRANFQKYGIKILLFTRLTPGIRAPVFITAGITHLSWIKFLIADGIYAVPGVTILFFLGYFFTDQMVVIVKARARQFERIAFVVIVAAIAGYLCYRILRKPVATGDPKEMPTLAPEVASAVGQVTNKILAANEQPVAQEQSKGSQ